MTMWLAVRSAALTRASGLLRRPTCRHYSAAAATSKSDPLRILFCGSDEFSCAALKALDAEKKRNPALIESLDVVVRPGKLTGRGMKQIREVPLKSLAEQLKLPIHVRDTFTGWKPHNDVNLIIAVSFGLFVPPRLLNLAKYGGLNVHPSALPEFRGPAPLHHTLLRRCTHTAVSLQTLHHKTFDHGTILSQTSPPGIPIPKDCTLQGLHDIVTPLAADMLVDGLRRGLHVPPLKDVGWKPNEEELEALWHAPKLTKRHSQVNWSEWNADDIVLRQRVLGSLWSMALVDREGKKSMRLILENVESVKRPANVERWVQTYFGRKKYWFQRSGEPNEEKTVEENRNLGIQVVDWLWHPNHIYSGDIGVKNGVKARLAYFKEKDGSILIPVPKGGCLRVPTIKVEGSSSKPAAKAVSSFGFIEKYVDNSKGMITAVVLSTFFGL